MSASTKVAYLKGLMDGIKLEPESDYGRLFKAVADVLEDMARELDRATKEVKDLGDGLDALSDDVSDLELAVFHEDDDDDFEDDEDNDDDETVYATTCPECEEQIYFDEDYLEDGMIVCPNCGAKLEFDAQDLSTEDEKK